MLSTSTRHLRMLLACAIVLTAYEICCSPCEAAASFPAEFPEYSPPPHRGVLLEDAYIAMNRTVFTTTAVSSNETLPVDVSHLDRMSSHIVVHEAKVVAVCGHYKWGQNWCAWW